MIELRAAHVVAPMSDRVTILIPEEYRQAWLDIASKPTVRKSRQLYVKIGAPRKPRTTGYRSQNHAIHGYAQQIAEYTGDYIDDVLDEAKRRAVSRGYPTRTNSFGAIVPVSETETSTVEAATLIEELLHIASDLDIRLREGDV